MSINFSSEASDEIITTTASLPEDSAEGSLRPRTLAEYIGQEKAKENLSVFIRAAKLRATGLFSKNIPPGGIFCTVFCGFISPPGACERSLRRLK